MKIGNKNEMNKKIVEMNQIESTLPTVCCFRHRNPLIISFRSNIRFLRKIHESCCFMMRVNQTTTNKVKIFAQFELSICEL